MSSPVKSYLSIRQWPSAVLNGATVGLGLSCITAVIGVLAGMPAAITAASGAAATSVADTVCAPQAKLWQMAPAVLGTMGVSALVVLSHASLPALTAVILLTTFASIFWMAWGKRGGPQTFVMILTLVFQMAAFHKHAAMDGAQAWRHLAWVGVGALSMAAWSALSSRMLARRYRTLALADSLDALAATMSAQARWTLQHGMPHGGSSAGPDTLALRDLIARQAGIADVFQSARDLLYSQAEAAAQGHAFTARQIQTLIHIVNLRDVVQASQLDLDRLPAHEASPQVLKTMADQLLILARRLRDNAHTWRTGQRLGMPTLREPEWPLQAHPVLTSLSRRCAHMGELVDKIVHAIKPPAGAQAPAHAPMQASLGADQAAIVRTLVSPINWPVAPLKAQLHTRSPVLRYAVRATLAVGCADGLAHVLPWASHPHWILMTVAVVMRGNLEQTLARRDARVQGTLVGCLIASALLTAGGGHSAWLLLALVVSLSLAHGFVLINYRVTAAAGAVLALVQGHLFNPSLNPALVDAAERLGDTLIGAALAWLFSYVLPSWERQQLPRLAQRLMLAQWHYAQQALRWHLDHERTPLRSLARREVYDVLWLLSQSLQRMGKEPRANRAWAPALETVLVHSNRLISHLAAIKGLLTVRQQQLDPRIVQPALAQSELRIAQWLAPGTMAAATPTAMDSPLKPFDERAGAESLDEALPTDQPLHDWLSMRLAQTEEAARLLAQAVQGLDAAQAAAPQAGNTL